MVDRLYENMLELISKRQEQHCNSTLCNLNKTGLSFSTLIKCIVIVHYVI